MNPITGRFWTMDGYLGKRQDPISLHKYLYAGCNPALYCDPTGAVFVMPPIFVQLVPPWVVRIGQEIGPDLALYIYLGYLAHMAIGDAYEGEHGGNQVYVNRWLSTIIPFGPSVSVGFNARLRPDIADATTREIYEIKSGLNFTVEEAIANALPQVEKYLKQVNDAISGANGAEGLPPGFKNIPFVAGVLWTPPPSINLLGFVNVSVTRVAPGVILYGTEGELEKVVALFGLLTRGPGIVAAAEEAEAEEEVGLVTELALIGGF
jgi:hypothetical protein